MSEQRFRTMWYKSRPGPDDFTIPDLDTRSPWYRLAFITRRSAIECPPFAYVVHNDTTKRQLHFFDHGCSLHDHTLTAFEQQMPATDIQWEFTIGYPTDHPMLRWEGHRLLVAISELDLRDAIAFDFEAMIAPLRARASKAEFDARDDLSRAALVRFQADRRWLIDLAPPELLVAVIVQDGANLTMADQASAALFEPCHEGVCARQNGKQRLMPSPILSAARAALDRRLQQLGQDSLSRMLTAVRGALDNRLFAVEADIENQTAAAKAEIAEAATRDGKLEFNRAIQRAADLRLELTEKLAALSLARLEGLPDSMKATAQLRAAKVFCVVPRAITAPP
jgi:hypothetical protein